MSLVAVNTAAAGVSNWFAVTMGIGTVFVGLLSIIIICVITGLICGSSGRKKSTVDAQVGELPRKKENEEIIAAVCAVCAENMGADVGSLKVVSFKKIG